MYWVASANFALAMCVNPHGLTLAVSRSERGGAGGLLY